MAAPSFSWSTCSGSTYGRRAFVITGPTAWNSLTDYLRDLDVTMDNFKRLLKMFLFSAYQCN